MQNQQQQQQMLQQQIQLQQIQIQSPSTGQPGQQQITQQFVTPQDTQQIQNQLMQQQQQQIALQQQVQNGITTVTTQPNGIQQITIQPKTQQILIGQQSVAQTQSNIDNRPIMTMVSIAGNSVTAANGGAQIISQSASPLNAMQTLSGNQLSSPPHLTLQPPPNPLAAMTSLSYNASTGMLTSTTANSSIKDEKPSTNASKIDEQMKANEQSLQISAAASLVSLSQSTMGLPASASIPSSITNGTPTVSINSVTTSNSSTSSGVKENKIPGKTAIIFFDSFPVKIKQKLIQFDCFFFIQI